LKAIQPRERILTNGHEEADWEVPARDRPSELDAERAVSTLGLVVQEVLLKLIQDDHEITLEAVRPLPQDVDEGSAADRRGNGSPGCVDGEPGPDLGGQAHHRVIAP